MDTTLTTISDTPTGNSLIPFNVNGLPGYLAPGQTYYFPAIDTITVPGATVSGYSACTIVSSPSVSVYSTTDYMMSFNIGLGFGITILGFWLMIKIVSLLKQQPTL